MYISSGKYKGKRVLLPKASNIRPMMSIVREAFFSILFSDIFNSKFLDVFAGTGIISLEALSRGAKLAHLVEFNRKAKDILIKNFSFVQETYKFYFQKAEDFLKKSELFYDFIYLDPPFNYSNKVHLFEIISEGNLLNNRVKIIIHYPSKEVMGMNIARFSRYDLRKYRGSMLAFFKMSY